MKKILIASSVLALALTGCATKPTNNNTHASNTVKPNQSMTTHQPSTQRFLCDNGISPVIHSVNSEQIVLEINNTRTPLNIARSGSGSLYVASSGIFGYGGEWHQSGNEANFTYKNVHGLPGRAKCSVEY